MSFALHVSDLRALMSREQITHTKLGQLPQDPVWDAKRIIELSQRGIQQELPDGMVEYIRELLVRTYTADAGDDEELRLAYERGLEEIWPALLARMQKSHGLAWYMMTPAAFSMYLPRFYATAIHPTSLEAAYNYCMRLDGSFCSVPETDVAHYLAVSEPIFRSCVFRDAAQQLVQLEVGAGAKVTVLGGGMVPEYNHLNWQGHGIKQQVTVYDYAPGAKKYAEMVYAVHGKTLAECGIDYRETNFREGLKDPEAQGTQVLVGAKGVMSYYAEELAELLTAAARLLKSGGYFCGELELMNIYTARCGFLGWHMDPMTLEKDEMAAHDRIAIAAKEAGLRVVEAVTDVSVNAMPAAVWFCLQKP